MTADVSTLSRQETIAMLLATNRYSVAEIADKVGVPSAKIESLRESPLFQTLVATYAKRFHDTAVDDVMEDIRADTRTNLRFFREVRDGDFDDDPKRMTIRLRAAEALFDKQVAKKIEAKTDTRVVINIDATRAAAMAKTLADDHGPVIDVEAETLDEELVIDDVA